MVVDDRRHTHLREAPAVTGPLVEPKSGSVIPLRARAFANYHNSRLAAVEAKVNGHDWPVFLNQVARAWPRRELHVVCGNASAHTHADVAAWLGRHPRIRSHFTPTSASWMNLVETFLGLLTRQAIGRGSFASVPDLVAAIGRYIQACNADRHPFAWAPTPTRSW